MEKYLCMFVVDIWEIHLETNHENIINVSLFDFCGQNRAGPIHVEQYCNKSAEVTIIMYDLSCWATKKEVNAVLEDCLTACESIPIVIVGNKVDMINKGTKT